MCFESTKTGKVSEHMLGPQNKHVSAAFSKQLPALSEEASDVPLPPVTSSMLNKVVSLPVPHAGKAVC